MTIPVFAAFSPVGDTHQSTCVGRMPPAPQPGFGAGQKPSAERGQSEEPSGTRWPAAFKNGCCCARVSEFPPSAASTLSPDRSRLERRP
ncbi:uncharacterized protein LOC141936804 isoform X7 [Strix uralensis]|uniref:uncharacterized protein LOC141936804 isoform X7 n=1 Tax=Strix uralensis TaxID=36305 RepID=UPI003DA783E7